MTSAIKLVPLGVFPDEARMHGGGDVQAGITVVASGNNVVAGAIPITGDTAVVTTSGAATNSAILTNQGAAQILVANLTANALNVFPPTGGVINALATNTSFAVTAQKSCMFVTSDGLTFYTLLSA